MYNCPRCASPNTKAKTGKKPLGPNMGLKERHCMDCINSYWTIEAIFKLTTQAHGSQHDSILEILSQHFRDIRNDHANWPINSYHGGES